MTVDELVEFAQTGKHTKLDEIQDFNTYKAALVLRHANRRIWRAFRHDSKKLLRLYLQNISAGVDDLHLLFEHRILRNCAQFYKDEADIIGISISRYHAFLFSGGALQNILGVDKQDEPEYDDDDF